MHESYPLRTLKADAARRQLGTALHLWLADLDPVSVHVLATGGCEVADALAKKMGKPFSVFALEEHPDLTASALVKLRNVYWNAMKHAHNHNGQERDDEQLLRGASLEAENEARLAQGWYDLIQVMPAPIEAQVLTVWFLAKFGNSDELDGLIGDFFPSLQRLSSGEQKSALRAKIAEIRENKELLEDDRTDNRPLIIEG